MSLGSVVRAEIEERHLSNRAFAAMTDGVVEQHPEMRRKSGLSIGTISHICNDQFSTELETLYIIALAFANRQRSAGEWLTRLILEAGYPLAHLTPEDLREWTEESILEATKDKQTDPNALVELRRMRRELDGLIQRLSGS